MNQEVKKILPILIYLISMKHSKTTVSDISMSQRRKKKRFGGFYLPSMQPQLNEAYWIMNSGLLGLCWYQQSCTNKEALAVISMEAKAVEQSNYVNFGSLKAHQLYF